MPPEQGPFSSCLDPSTKQCICLPCIVVLSAVGELAPFTGIFPKCWKLLDTILTLGLSSFAERNWVTLRRRGLNKGISDLRAGNGPQNSNLSSESTIFFFALLKSWVFSEANLQLPKGWPDSSSPTENVRFWAFKLLSAQVQQASFFQFKTYWRRQKLL